MTKLVPIHKPSLAYSASGFGIGPQTPVRVVLHDTECHDAAGITEIEGVASYWKTHPFGDGTLLGAHFIVDGDGNVGQLGQPTEELQHVGGLNGGSVGIEQIGFAAFTEPAWLARPKQLDKVARLLAWLNKEYGIPLVVPAAQGANQANHGVLTHAMVSRFEPASQGHTDPGGGYPLGHVLAAANSYATAGGWTRNGELPVTKPPNAAAKTITVRGGPNLEVIGHTAGVHRYVLNPAHAAAIRRAWPHLHFDKT